MALVVRLIVSLLAGLAPHDTPAMRLHAAALADVRAVAPHEVFGRITCARLGLHAWRVYEGIANPRDLDRGPGHYPSTTVPGLGGTVAIAGHRVTPVGGRPYGPFFFIDRLRRGDRITLRMPYGEFTYRVTRHAIVPAGATWFERYVGRERLVLTSCTPRYTALRRWVVFARLVAAAPTR